MSVQEDALVDVLDAGPIPLVEIEDYFSISFNYLHGKVQGCRQIVWLDGSGVDHTPREVLGFDDGGAPAPLLLLWLGFLQLNQLFRAVRRAVMLVMAADAAWAGMAGRRKSD